MIRGKQSPPEGNVGAHVGLSRELSAGVAVMMSRDDGAEEVDEEEVRKERLEKNKEWRKKKEREKWERAGLEPPPGPEEIKEKNRKMARKFEKKLHKELLCSNCR